MSFMVLQFCIGLRKYVMIDLSVRAMDDDEVKGCVTLCGATTYVFSGCIFEDIRNKTLFAQKLPTANEAMSVMLVVPTNNVPPRQGYQVLFSRQI